MEQSTAAAPIGQQMAASTSAGENNLQATAGTKAVAAASDLSVNKQSAVAKWQNAQIDKPALLRPLQPPHASTENTNIVETATPEVKSEIPFVSIENTEAARYPMSLASLEQMATLKPLPHFRATSTLTTPAAAVQKNIKPLAEMALQYDGAAWSPAVQAGLQWRKPRSRWSKTLQLGYQSREHASGTFFEVFSKNYSADGAITAETLSKNAGNIQSGFASDPAARDALLSTINHIGIQNTRRHYLTLEPAVRYQIWKRAGLSTGLQLTYLLASKAPVFDLSDQFFDAQGNVVNVGNLTNFSSSSAQSSLSRLDIAPLIGFDWRWSQHWATKVQFSWGLIPLQPNSGLYNRSLQVGMQYQW